MRDGVWFDSSYLFAFLTESGGTFLYHKSALIERNQKKWMVPFELYSEGEGMRIGIDFDNTLITYDDLFTRLARERGWLPSSPMAEAIDKRAVRDRVRLLEDGERKWRNLQAEAYGPCIMGAPMKDGAAAFLRVACFRGAELFVVSHKTVFAYSDRAQAHNLRDAALAWMTRHRFFLSEGFGIPLDHVFFESSRKKKVSRIAKLDCSHFIDDLPEVFEEPGFPNRSIRFLIGPHGDPSPVGPYRVVSGWKVIQNELFGDTGG